MAIYLVRMDHPDGPAWGQFVVEHVQYLKGLIAKGKLIASGPLVGTPRRAGFLIFNANDAGEVQALVAADPFSREGLIDALDIQQWQPFFGELAAYAPSELPEVLNKP
ncbi:YciI family protein [Gallaecimonas mangrovi]|uniref:YciI family protein n=1 Tax=Gallaecimonas mangrovi TaxID=2291597 RepID=UPI000E1FFA9F|nr:YciI family protein [Gallaecimonas mangrovi]